MWSNESEDTNEKGERENKRANESYRVRDNDQCDDKLKDIANLEELSSRTRRIHHSKGIQADPKKIDVIANWSVTSTVKRDDFQLSREHVTVPNLSEIGKTMCGGPVSSFWTGCTLITTRR
ncbi:hypothetical protein DPMN_179008 [Dreissena polymorpha]|uniref:Uncharacterized protein n=1 Tax=Dreissena polymorpha TaxID=45954 RepID=A0A9D4IJ65_DREPO|nr:hypothetical protein DPMN_179008 [Dreissena polymorpha]